MSESILNGRRSGFTLIEVLVTLILIGLLAAFVFPVIVPQLGAADPAKATTDLNDIKTAIEVFNTNVRQFPNDLEDLSNKVVAVTDNKLPSGTYTASEVNRWNGPYFDVPILPAATAGTLNVVSTGLDGEIPNALVCVDGTAVVADPAVATCTKNVGHFVSIQVLGLDSIKFVRANDLLDPAEVAAASDVKRRQGKLRCALSGTDCGVVYYLATPFHN